MPTLANYDHFAGHHWETGAVHNYFAARGFTAAHTGEPYSEALLLGVSGGITFGYFTFAYQGYDPQCNLLTRNTFDPLETMLTRLGVVQENRQTRTAARAEASLVECLEGGGPAIVWADLWSLPYNGMAPDDGMWGAFPLLVYGFERDQDVVRIADRARVPLTVTVADLAAARGRIKKLRYRLLALEAPDPDKVGAAVRMGIYDTIRLFTEKPPKGSPNNFGLKGLAFWAQMLREPKKTRSWAKVFPPGPAYFAGLTSAYEFAFLFGKDLAQDAERTTYAAFLDEAAVLLNNPQLHSVAGAYRSAAERWRELPAILLPPEVEPLARARSLLWQRHASFLEQGGGALPDMLAINRELADLREQMVASFPLTDTGVAAHREQISDQVLLIRTAEAAAVEALQAAMA